MKTPEMIPTASILAFQVIEPKSPAYPNYFFAAVAILMALHDAI